MINPKNYFIVLNEEKNQQFLSRGEGGGENIFRCLHLTTSELNSDALDQKEHRNYV